MTEPKAIEEVLEVMDEFLKDLSDDITTSFGFNEMTVTAMMSEEFYDELMYRVENAENLDKEKLTGLVEKRKNFMKKRVAETRGLLEGLASKSRV